MANQNRTSLVYSNILKSENGQLLYFALQLSFWPSRLFLPTSSAVRYCARRLLLSPRKEDLVRREGRAISKHVRQDQL